VLNNKYQHDITIVDKEENFDFFVEMVKKYMVLALPVLIKDDDILIDMKPDLIKAFLRKHTGK
jgi:hypothetical protein